jgi:glycolate oxidase iron-sulfur subunit
MASKLQQIQSDTGSHAHHNADPGFLKALDKCVHCGLCLNSCPTYRELHLEMDSPRGRIFQMKQVAEGGAITDSYIRHLDLCLACRGCETACPSGVQYGHLIEAARAEIEPHRKRPLWAKLARNFVFQHLLSSRALLRFAASGLAIWQKTGIKLPRAFGRLAEMEKLSPRVEQPFFFDQIGRVFPAFGPRRYRVALLAGCVANVFFARLNEATVRVLQMNGCEVVIPEGQTCCGALHVHAGLPQPARVLARQNIAAMLDSRYDAILTNAAGCGSTLKEYGSLLADDQEYAQHAVAFATKMKDVTEFLEGIELNTERMREVRSTVTYQDSCHLAHGQGIRSAPRELLRAVPGISIKEMMLPDQCCGSAGIYNIVEPEMSSALLEKKMATVNATGAERVVTANPGCMLQLRAGVDRMGRGQRVFHVLEILDEAYRKA